MTVSDYYFKAGNTANKLKIVIRRAVIELRFKVVKVNYMVLYDH